MLNSSFTSFFAAFAFAKTALSFPLVDNLLSKRDNGPPRLIQYVQTFTQDGSNTPLSLLPLIQEDTGVTHVILAALHVNGPNGDITLNDNNPNSSYYTDTWSQAAQLQQSGVKVMVMMGGAAKGSYASRLCSSSDGSVQDDYYQPVVSTLKAHNVDGIDLDIEEDVPLACPENLINAFRADMGSDFIITLAPVASDLTSTGGSALGGFSYSALDSSSAGQQVNWYNGQYYSGFVEGSLESSYMAAISNGYSPSQIVMGVLDNSAEGSGFVPIGQVQSTITNLKGDYSNFGGVDGWEYFNAGGSDDLTVPWQWIKEVGSTLFGTSGKRDVERRERVEHVPELHESIQMLMAKGYGQIAAARAFRLAKGDEVEAERMLRDGE